MNRDDWEDGVIKCAVVQLIIAGIITLKVIY